MTNHTKTINGYHKFYNEDYDTMVSHTKTINGYHKVYVEDYNEVSLDAKKIGKDTYECRIVFYTSRDHWVRNSIDFVLHDNQGISNVSGLLSYKSNYIPLNPINAWDLLEEMYVNRFFPWLTKDMINITPPSQSNL